MNPTDRVLLEIKTSRTGEETVDAMVQFLTSLTSMKRKVAGIFKKGIPISLEIAVVDQIVHFYVSVPVLYQAFVESQLLSQYPKALIAKSKDYLPDMLGTKIQGYKGAEEENSTNKRAVSVGMLKLTHPAIYPIRTAKEFKDVDPLSGVLSILSKSQPGDSACIQYLLVPAGSGWQSNGRSVANSKTTLSDGTSTANPYSALITEKISFPGFEVGMRILVSSETTERAKQYLSEIGGSFTSFIHPSGNGVVLKKPYSWQKTRLLTAMLHRNKRFVPRTQILNVQEIATLFHFPNMKLSTIQNLAWHKMILSDAPDTLPVAEGKTEEELLDINFFAKTEFKNKMTNFGVKTRDRMRHFYVIGKSGTGKSTFIANMAIDDLRKRRGFCVIDPHGDLCEHIMQFVPSYRVNDIAYMDPSDTEKSFAINPLEITHDSQKELVASSIVAIFKKLYGTSWGPRLEYILRNTIVSIIEMPDPTLLMVPEVLTNPAFRKKVIDTVKDPVVKSFWVNEFNWFWKEWNEAKRDPDSMSWQAPTLGAEVTEHGLVRKPHPLENPYIHWTEMESQFRNMTGLAFKQECLGEFIESGGALFPNVDECSIGVYGKERIEGHTYVIGIDIGKSIDFTVISTFDVGRREQVDILRFTGLSFDLQLGRIENQIRKWRPFLIIIESNAAGWAFIDFLTKQGYPVMGFTTSPTTKKDAFDALILAFDQKTISVIRDEQQMVELKSIQPIKLPSGGLKYAGPAEVHDDMVMAMALAWHGVDTFTGSWAAAISRYRESISPSMTRHNTAFITQVLDEEKNVIVAGAIIGFWEDKIVVHEARLLSHAPSEAVKFLMKAPSALVGCDLSCYQYYSGPWADLVDEMMRRDPNFNKSFYALKRPTDVEARQLAALSGTLLDERFILNHTLSDDVISWRLLHTPKSAILDAVAGAVELAGRYGTDE
jgi:hypothetical protein